MLRRTWVRTAGLAIVYRARLCLVLFGNLTPPPPCPRFLNEMLLRLFMKGVILGQAGGSGLYGSLELLLILTFSLATFRQRICQYLGL